MQTAQPDPRPPFEPQGETEPALQYGTRILIYILAHDDTSRFEAHDLKLADHCALYAVSRPDPSPALLARVRDAQDLIKIALRARQTAQEPAQEPPTIAPGPPANGPMAPLQPRPWTQPPSGQTIPSPYAPVDIRF
jgi:hypothetical protein